MPTLSPVATAAAAREKGRIDNGPVRRNPNPWPEGPQGVHGIPVDVGPTRHGITRGSTIYFFDPSGNRNEVFCGDYMRSSDREPITWDAEEIGKAIFHHDRRLNESFLTVVT